jgi:hypothetical protein
VTPAPAGGPGAGVVTWDDRIDAILAGDLTAGLGYRTPAGGVVVQAVAPIGLRDRAAGTIGFTTSLGFSRKLDRLARDQRVALAFHAREHGTASDPDYVLIQGTAEVVERPSAAERQRVRMLAEERLGATREGWFWNRWMREYYAARVPVHVTVERIAVWASGDCAGAPRVLGRPWPDAPPAAQRAPAKGTGPRVDAARAARRVAGNDHQLLGYAGADGLPVVVPVAVAATTAAGVGLTTAAVLPPGGRRAGLLGHSYRPQLIGLEARQYTGWLAVAESGAAVYAPHTEHGYKAPPNKTLLLLLNGALAKRGVRAARRLQGAPGSGSVGSR